MLNRVLEMLVINFKIKCKNLILTSTRNIILLQYYV